MKIVPTAFVAAAALLFAGGAASFALASSGQSALQEAQGRLDSDQAALSHDEGLLANERAIRRESAALARIPTTINRRRVIEMLRKTKGVRIEDFAVDPAGATFTLKVSGRYSDLVSAAATLPASVPGMNATLVQVDADQRAGQPDHAIETIAGSFR